MLNINKREKLRLVNRRLFIVSSFCTILIFQLSLIFIIPNTSTISYLYNKESNYSINTNNSSISISNNSDFSVYASSGNGSSFNPFKISDMYISSCAQGSYGISIQNTNVYFILQNITVTNCQDGILLYNVTNGIISHSRLENNGEYGIHLEQSKNIQIKNNLVTNTSMTDIFVSETYYTNITNNNFKNSSKAVYLYFSGYNDVNNNSFSNESFYTIYLDNAQNNNVKNNFINKGGISIASSTQNNIVNNTLENYGSGISSIYSPANNYLNNSIINNKSGGMTLVYSPKSTILNNSFVNNSLILDGTVLQDVLQTNVSGNLVNNKPLLYLQNHPNSVLNKSIPSSQIILVNSSNSTIENKAFNSLIDNSIGLYFSNNVSIINNSISNSFLYGLYILKSDYALVSNNTNVNNKFGIYVDQSSYCNLLKNSLNNNSVGLFITGSSNDTLTNNTAIFNFENGFTIENSVNTTIQLNLAIYNVMNGFYFSFSTMNIISNNTAKYNSIGFYLFFSSNNSLINNYGMFNTQNDIFESNSNNTTLINNTFNFTIPSAPLNLAAGVKNNLIYLSWSKPSNNGGSDIIDYQVYRATNPSGPYTILGSTSSLTLIDTSIHLNVPYYYYVIAINDVGASLKSNNAVATVFSSTTTSQTTSFTSTTSTSSQITATNDTVSTTSKIERTTTSENNSTISLSSSESTTSTTSKRLTWIGFIGFLVAANLFVLIKKRRRS